MMAMRSELIAEVVCWNGECEEKLGWRRRGCTGEKRDHVAQSRAQGCSARVIVDDRTIEALWTPSSQAWIWLCFLAAIWFLVPVHDRNGQILPGRRELAGLRVPDC
jgi:hypothetical protein